jgi:hypothetical protein
MPRSLLLVIGMFRRLRRIVITAFVASSTALFMAAVSL